MLKFEHIKPGTYVRAYDFEPREDVTERYVEGTVIRHGEMPGYPGAKALVVLCDVDTTWPAENYQGQEYTRVGEEVFVPMELGITEYDGRVQVVRSN